MHKHYEITYLPGGGVQGGVSCNRRKNMNRQSNRQTNRRTFFIKGHFWVTVTLEKK